MSLFETLSRRLTKEQLRFVRFLVVGASGVPVNLGVVFLVTVALPEALLAFVSDALADGIGMQGLLAADVRDAIAYCLGILVSIFTNFVLNNFWTWRDRTEGGMAGSFLARLLKFYLVSMVAAAVQLGTSVGLSAIMRDSAYFSYPLTGEYRVYHVVAPSIGILVALVVNFVANNVWTFRRRPVGQNGQDRAK